MKDGFGNGLTYVGDEGTVSLYDAYLEGRVVFKVMVDNADQMLRIFAHGNGLVVQVPGHADMKLYAIKSGPNEGDVKIIERLSATSIRTLVLTRIPWILADLYVPKTL